MTERPPRPGISRRGFVTGALGTGVAVGAGAALAGCSSPEPAAPPVPQAEFVPFEGPHQAGITTLPIPEQGLVASFNVHARDRAGLKATLQELTEEIRGLMAGKPPRDARPGLSARRLGHPRREAARRTTCRSLVGVGASLFDDRFGLADRKPKELVTMPFLANDRLDPEAVARRHLDHLRGRAQRHRAVRAAAVDAPHPQRSGAAVDDRRLRPGDRSGPDLGSRDPTKPAGLQGRNGQPRRRRRHPDGSSRLGGPDDGEPEWAVGGSYQAVRIIRMFVEFWDRTRSPSRRRSSAATRSAARRSA